MKRVKISLLGYGNSAPTISAKNEDAQVKLFRQYVPHMFTSSLFLGNEGSGFYAKGPKFATNFRNFCLRQPNLDHPEDFIWCKGGDNAKRAIDRSQGLPKALTSVKKESGLRNKQAEELLRLG